MAFLKGRSGNPAGMAKGTKHRLTPEVRRIAQRLFDAEYWRLKYERLHSGEEHPKIEALLLGYAFGPMERKEAESPNVGVVVHTGILGPMPGNDSHNEPERGALALVRGEVVNPQKTASKDQD